MHTQPFSFALVNCPISTYELFSFLFSLPYPAEKECWEWLGGHLVSSQGQPTTPTCTSDAHISLENISAENIVLFYFTLEVSPSVLCVWLYALQASCCQPLFLFTYLTFHVDLWQCKWFQALLSVYSLCLLISSWRYYHLFLPIVVRHWQLYEICRWQEQQGVCRKDCSYHQHFYGYIPYLREVTFNTSFNTGCSVWQFLLLLVLDSCACFSFGQLQTVNFGGQDCFLLLDSAKRSKALNFAWAFWALHKTKL